MVKPGKCSRSDRSSGNSARRRKKFSVYEFNPDDERVEKYSRKILSRCKPRSPKVSTSPVDKYSFLQCFMEGARACENDIEKEPVEIEDSDDESVCELLSPVTWLEHESSSANPATDHVTFALPSIGARSCIRESENSDQMFCVDSNDHQDNTSYLPNEHHSPNLQDDCVIDVKSSSSSELGEQDEEGAEYCSSAPCDAQEARVVVRPDFITFRNKHFTSASLTFSQKFIKLESFDCIGKTMFAVVWSISDIIKIKSFSCKKLETVFISLHLKSDAEEEAETIDNVSGITELNFSVNDPRCCQIQDKIKSLDMIYEVAWNTVVKIDSVWSEFSPVQQKSRTFPEVCSSNCYTAFEDFVYPHGDPDAVSVSMKDIELLQPSSFVNDTIIDFYVKYLEQHLRPEEKHRFHFFNSFFFRKLADLDKEPSTACEGRTAFQNVFRWTRRINLFEKDYLFIPVNFSLHWSLVVICHPGEVAKFTDEELRKSPKVPCIIHMDSIRGSHRGLNKLFRRYLWEEWKERYKETSQSVTSNFLNLLYLTPQLPQQDNSYDCGLFVLHYVECFLKQSPVHFSPYSSASSFLNRDWFEPAEASSRRDHIRNILYRIAYSNARQDLDPPTTDNNNSSCYKVEGDTDNHKRCQLETCHSRDSCGSNYSVKLFATSPPRPRMGRLGRTRESDVVVVGRAIGTGDSPRTFVDGTYQNFREAIPVDHFCNIMSPIEEEEATSTEKGGSSNIAEASLSRRILLPEINDVGSSPESSSCMSPILGEENHSALEVFLVVSDSEKTCNNDEYYCSKLTQDLDAYVVEDSLELYDRSPSGGIRENRTRPCYESCEQEVESPYVAKSHISEGLMAKPKCVITNQKGTLARYLSKDLRL